MWRFSWMWLVCLLGLTACKTDQERFVDSGAKPLTATELRELYVGNTMSGSIPSQNLKFHVYFHPDGRVAGKLIGGLGQDFDQGVYRIRQRRSQVCIHWARWLNMGCTTVYKLGADLKVFEMREGKLFCTQRMRKGNPEKLEFRAFSPAEAKEAPTATEKAPADAKKAPADAKKAPADAKKAPAAAREDAARH